MLEARDLVNAYLDRIGPDRRWVSVEARQADSVSTEATSSETSPEICSRAMLAGRRQSRCGLSGQTWAGPCALG